jgi:putative ABC transport system ATP-binding protein
MIEVKGLRFAWPRAGRSCLEIEGFNVGAGEAVFLHGPSGSGKSTLLGLLAGVLVPASGQVSLMGTEWASLAPSRRDALRADHVGYVFQQFNLLPYLSVLDNALLPLRFSALRRTRARKSAGGDGADAARQLLREVGLADALHGRAAGALSVGQQQRVAAARALVGRPELVIADEPTSALDASRRDGFVELLLRECRAASSALVFVSHDLALAARFDRTIALHAINRAAVEGDDS